MTYGLCFVPVVLCTWSYTGKTVVAVICSVNYDFSWCKYNAHHCIIQNRRSLRFPCTGVVIAWMDDSYISVQDINTSKWVLVQFNYEVWGPWIQGHKGNSGFAQNISWLFFVVVCLFGFFFPHRFPQEACFTSALTG